VRVDAVGVPVLSPNVDIANARLEFANGAIANLTASRVSREKMRKIRFFQANTYVSVDCLACVTDVYRTSPAPDGAKEAVTITHERLGIRPQEPLREEIQSFIECVRESTEPVVSGIVGRAALEIALLVIADIERRRSGAPGRSAA
jgi:predicted dehydrogenase